MPAVEVTFVYLRALALLVAVASASVVDLPHRLMLVVVAWPCAVAVAVMSVAVWYWNHHLAALVARSRCLVARLLLAHLDVCAYHLVRPVAVAVAVSASASAVVSAVPVETSVYQLEAGEGASL